ncbi:MAG: phosphodiester glycosidase family protein [Akkermansiaceae bacterium]
MRFSICALLALLFTSCFSMTPENPVSSAAVRARVIKEIPAPALPEPVTPAAPPSITVRQISGITFEGVSFDSRKHRLVVVDQPDGPGSRFADAAAAARARDGIAAINAGFFTPEGNPLGLVRASGQAAGAWNGGSSLGSAVWHEGPSGNPAISRREALGRSAAAGARELIQSGPLLVENGRATGGLEATKSSARTVVLWDGGTRWWIGRGAPSTLAALARALAHGSPAGWPVHHALNLDGGRSADLWISETLSGGPLVRRSPWNRPVRNFLVLLPK